MSNSYREWPPHWPMRSGGASNGGHSTEVEHRLTRTEMFTEQQQAFNTKTEKQLSKLERMVIIIVFALSTLAHEKLPDFSRLIATLYKAGTP